MNKRFLIIPVALLTCAFFGAIFISADKATEYVLKHHRHSPFLAGLGHSGSTALPQTQRAQTQSGRTTIVMGTKQVSLVLPQTAKHESEIVSFYTQRLESLKAYYMNQLQSEYGTALQLHRAKKMSDNQIVQKYAPIMMQMYATADTQVKLTLGTMKTALTERGYSAESEVQLQNEYDREVEMEMNQMSAKAAKVTGNIRPSG